MATLRTVIIDTDAVATSSNYYTGLAEAELAIRTANETDLVSRDEYIEFRCTGSAADTANVTFDSSSWVTSEDNYIAIIANDNHNGQWNENIYRLIPSSPPVYASLSLYGVNFARVIGLQIRGGHLNRSERNGVSVRRARHGYVKIHRNYILGDSASLSYASSGLNYYLGNAPGSQSIEITSNIFDGWINTLDTNGQGPTGSRGIGMSLAFYATRFVYNNTFINCSTGSWSNEVASTTYFENNLAYGNNLDFVFGGTLGGSNDYNASGDSTAIGSNSLTNISNPFVDYAGGDYSLRTQSPLLDAGNYQSASLEDVRGKTRVGTWDIGAFEKFLWTRANPSPELITPATDRTFDTSGSWFTGSGWTISSGTASHDGGAGYGELRQNGLLTLGKYYRSQFTLLSISGTNTRTFHGTDTLNTARTAPGTYVDFGTCTTTTQFGFTGPSGTDLEVDNVSVKEVKTIAKPSTELLTNGGFDTDTDWNKGSGWTISGGKANATSAGNSTGVFQGSLPFSTGDSVLVTFTIDSISEGGVAPFIGITADVGTTRTSPGTYTEIVKAGSPSRVGIRAIGTTTCVVDNVSAKLVKTIIK